MSKLQSFLREVCHDNLLSLAKHTEAVSIFGISYNEVEGTALSMGIVPLRYQRNQSTISPEQQKILFDSHIAIVGCGGLGGHIAEILTRIGIGRLSLVDFDHFEEHNLNRQNFSTLEHLGKKKVTVVKEALEQINPSIDIKEYIHHFDPANDMEMLKGADIVIDALDDPAVKLALSIACQKNDTNFVHGAIAGMNGQFSTNTTLEKLYSNGGRGAELQSGNPAFSVTLAASIMASEALKLMLGTGERLNDMFMSTDMLYNEFEKFPL